MKSIKLKSQHFLIGKSTANITLSIDKEVLRKFKKKCDKKGYKYSRLIQTLIVHYIEDKIKV